MDSHITYAVSIPWIAIFPILLGSGTTVHALISLSLRQHIFTKSFCIAGSLLLLRSIFANPSLKIEDVLQYGLRSKGKLVVTGILVYEHASLLEWCAFHNLSGWSCFDVRFLSVEQTVCYERLSLTRRLDCVGIRRHFVLLLYELTVFVLSNPHISCTRFKNVYFRALFLLTFGVGTCGVTRWYFGVGVGIIGRTTISHF